jgi:hypothetical protein
MDPWFWIRSFSYNTQCGREHGWGSTWAQLKKVHLISIDMVSWTNGSSASKHRQGIRSPGSDLYSACDTGTKAKY